MMRIVILACLMALVTCVGAETSIVESVREFQADFTRDNAPERLNVDIPVSIDFSQARAVAFEFGCEDLQTFSHFSLYFRSGKGWYATTFTPHVEGKTERLVIPLKNFGQEGEPDGWNSVSALRFSAWNGAPNKCTVTFGKVRAVDRDEADSSVEKKDTPEYRRRIAARISRMSPRANERRLAWCHSPWGLGDNRSWDESVRFLKESGFTDLIVNMAWGGSACYDSKVLARAADSVGKSDVFGECLTACRNHGVKMHVWKVCWHTWWHKLPKEVEATYRAEGRLQTRKGGPSKEAWLCPSNPRNQEQEIAAMCELADLGVDGVHYDYIRYPGYDCCFCEGCHERFERVIGFKVGCWPEILQGDKVLRSKWEDFRAANISAVVGSVAEKIRTRRPRTEISAAVMRNAPQDRIAVAQDWGRWCREGWLDFVCPMDYTESAIMFRGHLRRQKAQVAGIRFYPGIGMSCWQEDGGDAERFAEQLETLREEGCEGFAVFDFDRRAEVLFPLLRGGPLADRKTH